MTDEARQGRPAVSIIITCYNYENYVGQSIESALAQTFTDREIIVVDDGSTDGSAAVIARYADRIQSIRKENGGFIKACQTGLERSSGRFIMFLDADDLLEPTVLAEAAPFLDGGVSKIQFKLQPIDAAGGRIGTPFPASVDGFGSARLIAEIARRGCYDTPPTTGNIYRRDVYTQLGSLEYDYGIDGAAYLLAPFVGEVVFLQHALGRYRLHGRNMSGAGALQPARLRRDADVFLKRLSHVSEILTAKGIDHGGVTPDAAFQYVLERSIQARLVLGEPISLRDKLDYLKAIMRENRGRRRLAQLAFGGLSVFAPRKAALNLIAFRTDPTAYPRLRAFITRR